MTCNCGGCALGRRAARAAHEEAQARQRELADAWEAARLRARVIWLMKNMKPRQLRRLCDAAERVPVELPAPAMSHLERWQAGYELSPVPECPYPWCHFSSRDHYEGKPGAWTPADCEGCDRGEEEIPELEGDNDRANRLEISRRRD